LVDCAADIHSEVGENDEDGDGVDEGGECEEDVVRL
jgi:hypothetical protein